MNTGSGGGRRMATNINGVRQNNNSKKFISSFRRLKQDYMMIMKDPVPYVTVAPLQNDILEWHYVIHGPENTVYQVEQRLKTNTRLCLSFSDFHPDTWNPTWSLSTILTASDSVRRSYARKSLQFNRNDATFVELFPDIAYNRQESNNLANKNGSTTNDQSEYDRFNRFVWSCIYNLIALFIVILFAYIVQW
ncbi:Ubiquitin-conjugating enzyme E2 J2, partial [Dermatophagoides pteronyssinus]